MKVSQSSLVSKCEAEIRICYIQKVIFGVECLQGNQNTRSASNAAVPSSLGLSLAPVFMALSQFGKIANIIETQKRKSRMCFSSELYSAFGTWHKLPSRNRCQRSALTSASTDVPAVPVSKQENRMCAYTVQGCQCSPSQREYTK